MRLVLALLAALTLSACATTGGDPRDPWEGLNRKTYAFNDALDRAVLKPIAQGYQKVTPGFAQEGVNNFFGNLEDINTSLNNLLQGKVKEGAGDAARVVVNTVLGIFGLWDVASPMGLDKHDEDFGQTLGWWGVPPGPYFVIPLLGPSTARDAPARAADIGWYLYQPLDDHVYWALFGIDKVRTRANLLKAEGILDQAALDKYTFLRDAWLQRRRNQVFDGNPPKEKEEE